MWVLIVMTCLGMECSEIRALGVYSSEAACVAALDRVEMDSGASLCIRREPEEVKT